MKLATGALRFRNDVADSSVLAQFPPWTRDAVGLLLWTQVCTNAWSDFTLNAHILRPKWIFSSSQPGRLGICGYFHSNRDCHCWINTRVYEFWSSVKLHSTVKTAATFGWGNNAWEARHGCYGFPISSYFSAFGEALFQFPVISFRTASIQVWFSIRGRKKHLR